MTTLPHATLVTDPGERIARIEARGDLHKVQVHGQDVVWRRFGSGSPLVLIHGGHGSWLHWIRNIECLSAHHELWLPDLPGFGDSETLTGDPHAPDRFDRLVGCVRACIERLFGATPLRIAGFSFGGLVAANVAARLSNVASLALLGPAGHGGARRQTVEMIKWRSDDPQAVAGGLRHNLQALMLHSARSIDGLAMEVHERACRATRFRSKAISRHALLGDALECLHQPTLLVWGEHDVTAVPMEAAQRLASDVPYRDWCLIPGAGHWVQYERPQEVDKLLLRWFSATP